MTREEAIDVLKHNYPSACFTELCEAVNMAIEALEPATPIPNDNLINFGDIGSPTIKPLERKRGEWIIQDGMVVCSECFEPNFETNFCPNCGADMRERREDAT